MSKQEPSPAPAEASKRLQLARSKSATGTPAPQRSWKLLIVDDEEEIHSVTQLALNGVKCRGRKLEFLHAYSGAQACEIAQQTPDIALILLDVVMETDHAGLDVVRYIREKLDNQFVRIVLRTGQPGQAPEHSVITDYDINDYKHKTELTREKLFTTVYTSISSYRDLIALDANRRGLEEVIEASARIFDLRTMAHFAEGVLDQLTALLYLDENALMARASGLAAQAQNGHCEIVAGSGRFRQLGGHQLSDCPQNEVVERIFKARQEKSSIFGDNYYVGYHHDENDQDHLLYVSGEHALSVPDRHLIDLFIRNVSIAQTNVALVNAARAGKESS